MAKWIRFKSCYLRQIKAGEKTVTIRPWKETLRKAKIGDALILAVGAYDRPELIRAEIKKIEKLPVKKNALSDNLVSADCCPASEIIAYLKSKKALHFAAIWFSLAH